MNLMMVRHGEIPANVNKIYAGTSSEKLTPRGIRQTEEIADKLKSCNVYSLFSSPIQRAIQTAEIISKKIGKDLVINHTFREMELGLWEGMSENDIARMYPDEWSIWNSRPAELKLPGRETLDKLLKRVLTGLEIINKGTEQRNVVIVTHVAIIRVVLLWHARKSLNLYKSIHVPNAGIFEIKTDSYPPL